MNSPHADDVSNINPPDANVEIQTPQRGLLNRSTPGKEYTSLSKSNMTLFSQENDNQQYEPGVACIP